MKAGRSLKCLFWAMLYCVLYLVSASEEDALTDFDFTDLKEIDWNYDNENTSNEVPTAGGSKKYQNNLLSFDDYGDDNEAHPFDWRERLLRTALSRALTNIKLRQKFVEVMPILRVLSAQQRLALAALISAQINARRGQELKLEQVRMMFGDDRNLLIPIVYDIANMVRNSARNYLTLGFEAAPYSALQQTRIDKRKFELTSAELTEEERTQQLGTVAAAEAEADSSLEDFFGDVPEDVLDALSINEELQANAANTKAMRQVAAPANSTVDVVSTSDSSKRSRRDAPATDFVHKLTRSVPLSVSEEELLRGVAGRTVKLNTSSFAAANEAVGESSSPPPTAASDASQTAYSNAYQEVEDLAFANLNGTEVQLNVQQQQQEPEQQAVLQNRELDEPLPSPAELIAGPRYRLDGPAKGRPMRPKVVTKRKRVQQPRPHSKAASAPAPAVLAAPKKCERFTASMCIRTEDYPLEQIMGSINRHRNAMGALLAEYYDKPSNSDFSDDFDDFSYNKKRRDGEASGGGMCQSVVRYARPQKARSASGEWKFIVNTGQHTQTLRLEKCNNPQESCSYLAHNYRSHCAQVYNYHRLLSWDQARGLHVDIFKVPTCCSCQVDGYRQQFPPLSSNKAKDYTPAHYNADVYSTINEELDYNDDEDDDDLSYQLRNKYAHQRKEHGGYVANELLSGSRKVHTKAYPSGTPTVGSYLSPPGGEEYDTSYEYQSQRGHSGRRRPYKSLGTAALNEERVDLEIAPSELHTDKEVNFFGTTPASDQTRLPQKRKRIHSVPHTATSTGTSSAAYGTAHTHTHSTAATSGYSGAGHAAHAHQTPAASVGHYAPHSGESALGPGGSGGGVKSQPRFRSTAAGASAAKADATATTRTYRYPQPAGAALPPLYHVNPVFSAKYNASSDDPAAAIVGAKRINYSYHPIIDFFESNRRAATSTAASISAMPATIHSSAQAQLYPYKITQSPAAGAVGHQPHERRIGFGAGSSAAAAADNAWHPVVVES